MTDRSEADSRAAVARIILVAQDEGLRTVFARLLESVGHEVHVTDSAARALAMSEEHDRLDLLLTDVQLAEMTGLELAHRVRGSAPGVAVIAMSSAPGDAVRHSMYWRSDYAFIAKPFRSDTLLDLIEAALADG